MYNVKIAESTFLVDACNYLKSQGIIEVEKNAGYVYSNQDRVQMKLISRDLSVFA